MSNKFWEFKAKSFELICAISAVRSLCPEGYLRGGIGGTVKDKGGKVWYTFSGSIHSSTADEVAVKAIWFIIKWFVSNRLLQYRMVICSNSLVAVNAVNKGDYSLFPIIPLEEECSRHINNSVFIHFVPKDLNEDAVSLAQKGTCRPYISEFWSILQTCWQGQAGQWCSPSCSGWFSEGNASMGVWVGGRRSVGEWTHVSEMCLTY